MIDNYDSFTFNLVQYLSVHDVEVRTIRNDACSVADILEMKPELIVISPGPGRPEDAGVCIELIRRLPDHIPLFGVCLGFQALVAAFGGNIIHAPYLMHGKTSSIFHDNKGVFQGLPNPLQATRYHSLIAEPESLPDCLEVSARTEDRLIMGLRHKRKRMEAVQFHPESYLTQEGPELIRNVIETRGIMVPAGG